MTTHQLAHDLPPRSEMLDAFLGRDASYDGVFLTGVTTTGIFCRPSCPARKPKAENVSFFGTSGDALASGFRPCKRCRPLSTPGSVPDWLSPLLDAVEVDPARRWKDADLQELGYSPTRVRRWFKTNHGMTFQAYSRARRLGSALGRVQDGTSVTSAAFDVGYDSLSGFHDAFHRYFGAPPTDLAGSTVVHVDRISTPLGLMLVGATTEGVCLLEFTDRRMLPTQIQRLRTRLGAVFVPSRSALTERVEEELATYFEGRDSESGLSAFDLPLQPVGTPFQREVWDALLEIPYGETQSYAEIAAAVGRPSAVRAVGRANGMNAIAIAIPCHRVVGADGRLVGYGGGLWRKKRLLELERGDPDIEGNESRR